MKKKSPKRIFAGLLVLVLGTLGIYTTQDNADILAQLSHLFDQTPSASQLADIPDYDGEHQDIEINQNKPTFTKEELALTKGTWEEYSDLDPLNRVGVANAMLGKDLFPTEKREPLYVNPTGWNQKKLAGNQWLYNRSHLIGYQLTGQNNNLKNLMTGTRSLNSPHMLVYENDITNYIKTTNHHVRYRVTPYFKDDELLARGVQLEAQSIEDNDIQFNVFIYNVQEGMSINYQTGQAKKE
ncbi:DNA-entry nuclease [Enterococcus sp. JM4C]|uniref:DNA/RNA non-specific endonuclease n=1 Tax=Candidatus Enterococcus huntleyi TaxID=1857217 RepID=UPI001F1DC81F|nr:DNA/RNA non-specific endonuclease [Enterococcus sp. JM4C]KAF1295855.1 DNA-entry nuclease [Enterococcus sp. JM4C]